MTVTSTGHHFPTQFFGLSTDTKPDNPMVAATFLETDTRHEFTYDGENWVRDKAIKVEQSIVEVAEERNETAILDELLVQQKITNAHLAIITGERFTEEDLDGTD